MNSLVKQDSSHELSNSNCFHETKRYFTNKLAEDEIRSEKKKKSDST